jgi:hypothetical protein
VVERSRKVTAGAAAKSLTTRCTASDAALPSWTAALPEPARHNRLAEVIRSTSLNDVLANVRTTRRPARKSGSKFEIIAPIFFGADGFTLRRPRAGGAGDRT